MIPCQCHPRLFQIRSNILSCCHLKVGKFYHKSTSVCISKWKVENVPLRDKPVARLSTLGGALILELPVRGGA